VSATIVNHSFHVVRTFVVYDEISLSLMGYISPFSTVVSNCDCVQSERLKLQLLPTEYPKLQNILVPYCTTIIATLNYMMSETTRNGTFPNGWNCVSRNP